MKIDLRSWSSLVLAAALGWTPVVVNAQEPAQVGAQSPIAGAVQPAAGEPTPAILEALSGRDAAAAEGSSPYATTSEPSPSSNAPSGAPGAIELVKERHASGSVRIEREMVQDADGNYVFHGMWRRFDEQGRLIVDGRFESNQMEGEWRRYYDPDQIPLLTTAPYSEFTGPFTSTAEFKGGRLHGKWRMTDSEKKVVHEIEFAEGQRHGTATWFHANGSIALQARYEQGTVNGDVTKFSDDSTVLEKETYAAGRKLHTKIEYHDAEGKSKKQEVSFLEAPLTVDKPDNWGAGTLATFKMEGKGERHGQYRIWYANGQLAREGEFCHDQPCGKITTWYPNGQPQLEGLYAEGHQEGSWTWWFENGQKATSGEYRQGEAVGSWSWWTSAGKVVRRTDLPRSRTIENLSPESGGEIREAKVQPKQGMGLPLR